jgi:hypothetical protein
MIIDSLLIWTLSETLPSTEEPGEVRNREANLVSESVPKSLEINRSESSLTQLQYGLDTELEKKIESRLKLEFAS